MALELPKRDGKTGGKSVERTHEATGITVCFKRLGYTEITRLICNTDGYLGDAINTLMQPGVGVMRWEGVTQGGNPVPYSTGALDAVCEVAPDFGSWFNRNLMAVNNVATLQDAEMEEKKSEAPLTGSEADRVQTVAQ